jgi:DNA modification methylase
MKTDLSLSDLKPNPENPRTITDDGLKRLAKSLKKNGDMSGIVFNRRTGTLSGGHQRVKVLPQDAKINITKKLDKPNEQGTVAEGEIVVFGESFKYREVDWSKSREKAANLAANKMGGVFNEEMVAKWLHELKLENYDMEETGFSDDEILKAIKSKTEPGCDENEVPEPPKVPKSKSWQIYQLGPHRLMCGDSTDKEAVAKLMDGKKANLVITDPPYNVAVNDSSRGEKYDNSHPRNRRKDNMTIQNDKMSDQDFLAFLKKVFTNYHEILDDGGGIYVFYSDSMTIPFMTTFAEAGFHFAQNCIWNKQQFVMTRKDYHYKHEPILYGWKLGKSHLWNADRKQSSVWDFDRPFKSELHPTMKPIELVEYPLKNSSVDGGLVVDLFGGSGSTLIACEKNNRKCFMMELDPKFVDVIIERWEKYTGQKAKLLTPETKTVKAKHSADDKN